jgi:hypothetical protein
MSIQTTSDFLRPQDIARALGIGHAKVLLWIQTGELKAINVSTKPTNRPRYKIRQEDYAAFLAGRETHRFVPATRKRGGKIKPKPKFY